MIHAYDKAYLDKARVALGRMLDFAVYDLEYDISDFFDLFISSGVASRFEQGDFTLLAGMSGIEIAYTVLDQAGVSYDRIKPEYAMDRSEEFWTLAYYQWARAISFRELSVMYRSGRSWRCTYPIMRWTYGNLWIKWMNSTKLRNRKQISNCCGRMPG